MPLLWLSIGAVLVLVITVLVRAFTFGQSTDPVAPAAAIPVDADAVAERLARIVRCETVSFDNDRPADAQSLESLHAELREMYPLVHARLELEVVNDHALLYTWPGTDDGLEPILLAAHQDVVPADEATLSEWEHPPFAGQIADGYVWGRGTLDNKHQLIAVMEAVEILLQSDLSPQRTVYLGFGHDEEIGGRRGAKEIAAWLQERGVRLEAMIDEGGALMEGMLPGVKGGIALVGNAEKGYATLELSVSAEPGHSAMPPKHTAIGILAQALTRLERSRMPADSTAFRSLVAGMGKKAPFLYRLVFANLWLLGPIVHWALGNLPMTNALTRTTIAATMISGGIKENILPRTATACVNSRILVGNNSDQVLAHVKRAVRDEHVRVRKLGGFSSEPSPISPTDSAAYRKLGRAIRQTFGDVAVAPFLMIAASDTRHYTHLCDNIYRFAPLPLTSEDLGRIHGINERISVADLGRMVQFYGHLIKTWTEA
ncbi:MAG: M20 family peptidase [Anaerolineae bacterium]